MNIIFILNQTHLKINIIIGVQNYYFSLNIIYLKMTKVKKLFRHEHIIYSSDFFIKKITKSIHRHIDGTFLFPKDFPNY